MIYSYVSYYYLYELCIILLGARRVPLPFPIGRPGSRSVTAYVTVTVRTVVHCTLPRRLFDL